MDQPLMGRQIKADQNLVCDWEHPDNPFIRVIPKGKIGYQVIGEGIEAQGLYHSYGCYEQALKNYRDKKKEMENE